MRIYSVKWIPGNADAITLPPFGVFVENDDTGDKYLLAHEKGHWQQYQERGFFGFYWWVFKDYVFYGLGRQDSDSIEVDADRRAEQEES